MHSHDDSHDHRHNSGMHAGNKAGLTIALWITAGIMFLEFAGGFITNSLALLSDAGHMLSDVASLTLSLVAIWFAAKTPSPNKTYGFYRFEILAALCNGAALFAISGFIIWEAFQRFSAPPAVNSASMMVIAFTGLLANLLSAWVLIKKGDVKENVNLRSAYLHVLGDALGSLGAIMAGILMYFFNWYIADPIISIAVSLLILKSAWGVINYSVHVLMEGTPVTIDAAEVEAALLEIAGVKNVHDLHIWTITSGLDSLSCHLLIDEAGNSCAILQEAIRKLEDHFKIQHTTIQIETVELQHSKLRI